jgi:hypothetical protein
MSKPNSSVSMVFDNFVKSPHDKCNYRLITLNNSLQACLVSEPGLEKVKNPGLLYKIVNNDIGNRLVLH